LNIKGVCELKLAVLQSNYIPWRGYFDIIHDVDLFLFYDEVKYTKNDWRNRNIIKTDSGLKWITLPCGKNYNINICEVLFNNSIDWQKDHFLKLESAYHYAPYFNKYKGFLEYVYMERKWDYLFELNRYLIESISREFLGMSTKFSDSREYPSQGIKAEKLLSLIKSTGADYYLSGPAAKDYIEEDEFTKAGIVLDWKDYANYPSYPQLYDGFEPRVSILDLLFNVGDDAPYYIWGWRDRNKE
jgi:hypothetical protein